MTSSLPPSVSWKWCTLPVLAMVMLALIPQIHFWVVRGSDWQGAYAILQGDETYYSAYVNALIDGRPRRNDPFTGQDDQSRSPMAESLFSIQFIPPYVIALFARVLGFSASQAFILLVAVVAMLASLSVFWLLAIVTGDSKLAAVGTLVVLCLGTAAGGQGWIGLIVNPNTMFGSLLFLRRYLPSAPFPIFFLFCALIFQALTSRNKTTAALKALLAGIAFSILVFSYFYLWTAALAWVVCLTILWLVLRPNERRHAGRIFALAGGPMVIAFLFYGYLLSNLPPALEEAQALTLTRRPDLSRIPEIIGVFMVVALIFYARRKQVILSEPKAIFATSFAILPLLVFNQQVVTGRSIQPYHYEVFIVNYAVLTGMVILIKIVRPVWSDRFLAVAASLSILWGAIEVNQQFKLRSTFDVASDEMVPVLLRLRELANQDGTWQGLRTNGKAAALVFSPHYGVSRLLPTWAPQGSLLSPGSAPFQSLARDLRKEWLYTHFYYCGLKKEGLRELLNRRTNDLPLAYFVSSTIFGNERANVFLSTHPQPIQQAEIDQEVLGYESFIASFSREKALNRPLTYVVTLRNEAFDFSRLDQFYSHDEGESVGAYLLYRLKLRE